MIERDVVAARLERFREYLKILKQVQRRGLDDFRKDPLVHGAAERYLQLAIECLLDIGNHIISDRGYAKPESYGQILKILSREGVVPDDLARDLDGMAAFRNILVHDYLRVDLDKVYDLMREKLPRMEALGKVFASIE